MPQNFSAKSILRLFLLIFLAALFAGCTVIPAGTGQNLNTEQTPQLPQPKTLTDPTEIELLNAIQTAASGREDVMAFIVYRVTIDHVQYSDDKNLALVWIALVDKNTGLVQSGEPGLIIAHRNTDPAAGPWRVVFQADPTFADELNALPESLMSADTRMQYMPAEQQAPKSAAVYSGYLLPWTGGEMHYLTGSIGHVYTYKSCPSTCLYAFDFANGTMFPIRAAKAGTVKYAVWQYPNGNTTNANYIVLEDTTTVPTTYQVYLHLAQNSIPEPFRTVGARVVQGQFIGNADDTGASTGNHLHFHVHTNPDSYWGTSVDITFDDVTVNGGRPRMCSEASAYPQFGSECMPGNKYISGNSDKEIPTGGLTDPVPNAVLTAPWINISGWMKDDLSIKQAQLVYSLPDGTWANFGIPQTVTPFTTQVNLCASNIPDGNFSISLIVQDKAGNFTDPNIAAVPVNKQASCNPPPPPVCTVGSNQAALYSEVNFQGTCQVLDIGNYPDLDALAVKVGQAKSVTVNPEVSVILYPQRDFGGLPELLQTSDANLTDNPYLASGLASIRVPVHANPPASPELILPSSLLTDSEITLSWSLAPGSDTSSQLTGPNGYSNALDWQSGTSWSVGLLPEGTYQWTVQARNLAGSSTASQEFTIVAKASPPVSEMQPLPETTSSTDFLLQWVVTAGADRLDHFELQYRVDGADWLMLDPSPAGDARQVVFNAEPGRSYEFRIRAVGTDGTLEAFTDAAEASTRVLDATLFQPDIYEGATGGDNSFASAAPLVIGDTQEHNWVPANDIDWVVFQAKTGQDLHITTEPLAVGSAAAITLFDVNGTTVLGSVQPADDNSGAALDWIVPADGTYSLQLSPVNPAVMGSDARYKLSVEAKGTIEVAPLICGGTSIPAALGGLYLVSKSLKKKRDTALGR